MLLASAREILRSQQGETDWERLKSMSDEQVEAAAIADPDALPTDDEFWEDAEFCPPLTFL